MKVVAAPVAWNVKVVASGARALRQVRDVVLESFSCHLASKRCSSNSSSFTWKFRGSWKLRQAVLVQALTEGSRQLLFFHYNKIVDINIAITRDSYVAIHHNFWRQWVWLKNLNFLLEDHAKVHSTYRRLHWIFFCLIAKHGISSLLSAMVQHNKKLQVKNSKQNEILTQHHQFRPQIACLGAHTIKSFQKKASSANTK